MEERSNEAAQAERTTDDDRVAGEDRVPDDDGSGSFRFGAARQEILIAAVSLAVFVYLRLQIGDLVRGRRGAAYLDPDFWPGWLLNVLILLALIFLAQAIMRARRPPEADVDAEGDADAGDAAVPVEPAGTAGELGAEAPSDTEASMPGDDAQPASGSPEADVADSTVKKNPVVLMVGFGLIFAFIWLMPRMGFLPSMVLFCVAFLLAVGERRWKVVVGIPTVMTALILYVFTRLLVVPLPRGRGFFLELSTFFY